MTLAGLAIGGVEITDAGVIWDDQQAGTRYEVEGLSLRTGAIEPGEAVPVELELALCAIRDLGTCGATGGDHLLMANGVVVEGNDHAVVQDAGDLTFEAT